MNPTETKWLIWSMEHNAFWAPACQGYATRRDAAGTYSYDEAVHIVRDANYGTDRNHPNEAMILVDVPLGP